MIECTRYSEIKESHSVRLGCFDRVWSPGVLIRDDRGYLEHREPYAKLLRHPAKLDHERPWGALVTYGTTSTRSHHRTARRAFRWASSLLRATITGGMCGEYGMGGQV